MNIYKYGLSNTLRDIKEALEKALDTSNKHEKARYIGEAYGMVKAIDLLIDEEERLENNN